MIHFQPLVSALLAASFGAYYKGVWPFSDASVDEAERFSCRPFLPRVLVDSPPSSDHASIRHAVHKLDGSLSQRFSHGDIDSLSVAVVTSKGPVFEKSWGVVRGNESASSPLTTSHASYRIASVSKLITVLEGMVLEQKGFISWEDPVEKYLPQFQYRLDGFGPFSPAVDPKDAPITLFELVTHTSGLGRDWPPGTVHNWPYSMEGGGPPPTNGLPFPSHESLYKATRKHHLTSPPYAYPAYSNTGTGLLGMALVAANRAASEDPSAEPDNYADLLKRDIFGPMGLNGSHFLTTDRNKHLIVVPSLAPEVADQDFLDAMNPAGGQFSSLADCITIVETLLNPAHPKSLLTRFSLDKWLHHSHDFDEDQWTATGFIWEIIKHEDSNGRLHKVYWKRAMAGYHAAIAIHPASSYGIVVLLGGHYPDAAKLAYDAFNLMQPAFDNVHAELSASLYSGKWASDDGNSSATVTVERGTLYAESLILNGSDVLAMFHAPSRVPLRSSERRDEFRLDTGIPFYNGKKHMGCYPFWNGQDLWGLRNNAPINLLYFMGSGKGRTLVVPSVEVEMRRV